MSVVQQVLTAVLLLILFLLIARMALDWIQVLSRSWRPAGVILVIAEGVYTLTDPVLRPLRRVIPPLRIGRMALDMAFMVAFFTDLILLEVVVPRL